MPKELRSQLEDVLSRFSREVMDTFRAAVLGTLPAGRQLPAVRVAAAPAGHAAPATRGRRGPKSSPEEVRALSGRILDVLHAAPAPMSAREVLKILPVEPGSFHYALGRLKDARSVTQHGERRFARYWVADARAAKAAKPVPAAKVAKPVKAVKVAKPVKAVKVEKPVKAVKVEKPVKAVKVAKPVAKPVVDAAPAAV